MKLAHGIRPFFIAIILSLNTSLASAQDTVAAPEVIPSVAKADGTYYDAVKAHILGDDKQSETLLLQVVKDKPNEGAPYFDLARIAFRQNNTEKATEYIKKAIALEDSNKWYHELYANILILKNKYEEAGDEFAKLAKTEKYNEDYLMKTARLYQRSGKYKDALAALEQLQKKDASDEDVLMQEQEIYLKMNDVPGAVKVVQKLIDLNPHDAKYYTVLAEIYENNKQADKAAAVYKDMQTRFPDDPSLQLSLAAQYLKKGDTAQYKAYVQKAITNKGLDAQTQIGLLGPYLQEITSGEEQRKEALTLIEKVVEQHPQDPQVLSFYGDVLRLSNRPEEAAIQYKKVVAANPSSFLAWQQLLYAYSNPKDADSMILYSEKAARLFPNQAIVHYLNGVGHYNRKEYPAAIKSINRAIDLQPEEGAESGDQLADMYSTLGDIYNTQKDYKQSDSSFEHALRLNAKNATVLNNYAYYLSVRNQRLADAEKMSKRSLELRPGEGTFLDTYGWILYQEGKYAQAKTYIQQALDAAKGDADGTLYEHLGAVEFKLGNPDKAVDAWKKAKAKGAENPALDKMIEERKLYE